MCRVSLFQIVLCPLCRGAVHRSAVVERACAYQRERERGWRHAPGAARAVVLALFLFAAGRARRVAPFPLLHATLLGLATRAARDGGSNAVVWLGGRRPRLCVCVTWQRWCLSVRLVSCFHMEDPTSRTRRRAPPLFMFLAASFSFSLPCAARRNRSSLFAGDGALDEPPPRPPSPPRHALAAKQHDDAPLRVAPPVLASPSSRTTSSVPTAQLLSGGTRRAKVRAALSSLDGHDAVSRCRAEFAQWIKRKQSVCDHLHRSRAFPGGRNDGAASAGAHIDATARGHRGGAATARTVELA